MLTTGYQSESDKESEMLWVTMHGTLADKITLPRSNGFLLIRYLILDVSCVLAGKRNRNIT